MKDRINTLHIMRGLPGAGKTTRAKSLMRKNPGKVFRVNRSAIREMLWPAKGAKYKHSHEFEALVIAIEDAILNLIVYKKFDAIIDDTNLTDKIMYRWKYHSFIYNIKFKIISFLHVKIKTCIKRDKERGEKGGKTIGKKIIKKLAERIDR